MSTSEKTPIKPGDIRRGDLIRKEYAETLHRTTAHEYFAEYDGDTAETSSGLLFLLSRPVPPVVLPTEPGTTVRWLLDGAYLPIIAQLDAGYLNLGWRCGVDDDPRWFTAEQLASRMAGAEFEILRPVADVAAEVLGRLASWWEFGPPLNFVTEFEAIAAEFGATK